MRVVTVETLNKDPLNPPSARKADIVAIQLKAVSATQNFQSLDALDGLRDTQRKRCVFEVSHLTYVMEEIQDTLKDFCSWTA